MSDNGKSGDVSGPRFELIGGMAIAIFAAVLALNELGAGKFGYDELLGAGKKTEAWNWYQSKSVKQSLVEGQRDLLATLVQGGIVDPAKAPAMSELLARWDAEVARYKQEKKEIMLGSGVVGQPNWVQEVDGKLGMVKGAKEWEEELVKLGRAGDIFDVATLLL